MGRLSWRPGAFSSCFPATNHPFSGNQCTFKSGACEHDDVQETADCAGSVGDASLGGLRLPGGERAAGRIAFRPGRNGNGGRRRSELRAPRHAGPPGDDALRIGCDPDRGRAGFVGSAAGRRRRHDASAVQQATGHFARVLRHRRRRRRSDTAAPVCVQAGRVSLQTFPEAAGIRRRHCAGGRHQPEWPQADGSRAEGRMAQGGTRETGLLRHCPSHSPAAGDRSAEGTPPRDMELW